MRLPHAHAAVLMIDFVQQVIHLFFSIVIAHCSLLASLSPSLFASTQITAEESLEFR